MDKVFNSNMTNPANLTDYKINIGLFSGYSNFSNSFSYRDAVLSSGGNNVLDLDNVINGLVDNSNLISDNAVQSLSIAFAVKDWNFSLYHNVRNNNQVSLPKELLEFAWRGNAQFIGQEVNIAPQFNMQAYNEIGFGIARKFNKLTIGARFKKLNGIANFHTDNGMLMINTAETTYDMNIQSDFMINGSAAVDFGGFDNLDFDTDGFKVGDLLKSNKGFGFDIGASYQLNSKLQLSFSMLDIGSINWTDNTYNYHSEGQYLYTGFDAAEALSGDDDNFEETMDALQNELDFQETSNSFSSSLPTKTYLSAQYRVSHLFGVGALLFTEKRIATNETSPGFAINGSLYLGNKTSLGMTYSMRNEEFGNLGFHAATSLGTLQVFAVADNILPVLDPLNNRNVDLRFGVNVAFKQRYESMTRKSKLSLRPREERKWNQKKMLQSKEIKSAENVSSKSDCAKKIHKQISDNKELSIHFGGSFHIYKSLPLMDGISLQSRISDLPTNKG